MKEEERKLLLEIFNKLTDQEMSVLITWMDILNNRGYMEGYNENNSENPIIEMGTPVRIESEALKKRLLEAASQGEELPEELQKLLKELNS